MQSLCIMTLEVRFKMQRHNLIFLLLLRLVVPILQLLPSILPYACVGALEVHGDTATETLLAAEHVALVHVAVVHVAGVPLHGCAAACTAVAAIAALLGLSLCLPPLISL